MVDNIEDALDYNLRLDDFIDHLVASPNFKYSYSRMWLREILTEWASEIEASDLFAKGSGQDILPMWINYVIQKLRSSAADNCAQLCLLMQQDINYFYGQNEAGDWKCLRNEIIEKLLKQQSKEEIKGVCEESSVVSDESEHGEEYSYQVFSKQFQYLINLIEQRLPSRFKFLLFSMVFRAKSENQPTTVVASYMLHFPKKYMPSKNVETLRVAKISSQAGMERTHQFITDMSSDEEGVTDKSERKIETRPVSMIMPLSQALNIDSAFWAYKDPLS